MDTPATMTTKPTNLTCDNFSPESQAKPNALITLDAEDLLAGSRELRLIYRGEEYRLRITRNNKLLLTK